MFLRVKTGTCIKLRKSRFWKLEHALLDKNGSVVFPGEWTKMFNLQCVAAPNRSGAWAVSLVREVLARCSLIWDLNHRKKWLRSSVGLMGRFLLVFGSGLIATEVAAELILPKTFPWVRGITQGRGVENALVSDFVCLQELRQDSARPQRHRFSLILTVFNSRKLCKSIFADGEIESVFGTFSRSVFCLAPPRCTLLYSVPPRGLHWGGPSQALVCSITRQPPASQVG